MLTRNELIRRAGEIYRKRLKRSPPVSPPTILPSVQPVQVHNSVHSDSLALTVKEMTQHVDLHPTVNLSPDINLQPVVNLSPNITVEPGVVNIDVPQGLPPVVNVAATVVNVDMVPLVEILEKFVTAINKLLQPKPRKVEFTLDKLGNPTGATIQQVK